VAAAQGARVIEDEIPNRSRARNLGAEAARTGLYAFTDADCVADPGWLEALLRCAHTAPLVAGDVRVRVSEKPNAIERFEALWRFGQAAWVKQGWAATANLLVHAEAFEAVRGFDPGYDHIGEDADFCLRATQAGFSLGYCPDAVVEHDGERELRPFLGRMFRHGYGANQTFYRLRAGRRAWRHPGPALLPDRALQLFNYSPDQFKPNEWRRMAQLAQIGYAARVAGSVWAEVKRAR
jgi:GT2 family glycosyltransferase